MRDAPRTHWCRRRLRAHGWLLAIGLGCVGMGGPVAVGADDPVVQAQPPAVSPSSGTATPDPRSPEPRAGSTLTAREMPALKPPAADRDQPTGTLSLAQAERLLLERNLTISAARSGIDAAKASELIARYRPNPSLTVSAEQFTIRHPFLHATTADPASQGYQHFYTVRIDQVLERGGKRALRRLASSYQRQAAEATFRDTIRQQLFQLRQAYLAAVQARQALDLARDELALTDQTISMVASQVDLGRSAGADLLRLQVAHVQVQQTLDQAEMADLQAGSDLLNLLDLAGSGHGAADQSTLQPGMLRQGSADGGHDPGNAGRQPASVGAPSSASPSAPASASAPAPALAGTAGSALQVETAWQQTPLIVEYPRLRSVLEGRGDVQAARHALEAADVAVRQARALAHEDVDLGLEYQRNGGDNTVGVSLQVPLPVFNTHRADELLALAQLRQAQAQYRQILGQAVTDLDKAWQGYLAAARILALYQGAAVGTATQSLHIAQETYREGGAGLLSVLDALHAYNATCAGFHQAQASYRLSLFQLEQATGEPLTP